MKDFINFIREQGIIGFATGFIVGGAVSKLVTSFVDNIINPILGVILSDASFLTKATINISGAEILIGEFLVTLIDFTVLLLVVYVAIKKLGLVQLDRKKENK